MRSTTGRDGRAKLNLPNAGYYVLTIRHGDHEEVLFVEQLEPAVNYVYKPDPEILSGRINVLATYRKASKVRS
jgi:hypothetical protein